MVDTRYPYKLRVGFHRGQEKGLKLIAERRGTTVTALIREFVSDGIRRSGVRFRREAIPGGWTLNPYLIDDTEGDTPRAEPAAE